VCIILKTNKPDIAESMMFMLVHKRKHSVNYPVLQGGDLVPCLFHTHTTNEEVYNNFIIPLSNFRVVQYETYIDVTIKEVPLKVLNKLAYKRKYIRGAICLCTDPRIEHCADWSDLGCFRFLFKMNKPKISREDKGLKFRIDFVKGEGTIGKDIFLPDREQ
jgi:hypothetical protein